MRAAFLLGIRSNDYHKGIHNLGDETLESLISKYFDDGPGLVQYLTNQYPAFGPSYKRIDAIYTNAPVFEMSIGEHDNETKSQHVLFTGRIVSHEEQEFNSWVDYSVGFDPHQLIYMKCEGLLDRCPSYKDIASGKWLATKGESAIECIILQDKNDAGEDLPFG